MSLTQASYVVSLLLEKQNNLLNTKLLKIAELCDRDGYSVLEVFIPFNNKHYPTSSYSVCRIELPEYLENEMKEYVGDYEELMNKKNRLTSLILNYLKLGQLYSKLPMQQNILPTIFFNLIDNLEKSKNIHFLSKVYYFNNKDLNTFNTEYREDTELLKLACFDYLYME